MGYSLSWLAVQGVGPASVLERLDLIGTGAQAEYAEEPFVGRLLPSGWYLVVARECDHRMISGAVLESLSAGCSVLTGSVEEHVMYAASALWRDGREIWRVAHNAERGIADLEVSGQPPSNFDTVRASYAAKQVEDDEVDWHFEIPLVLAREIAGFKHDEGVEGVAYGTYDVLHPVGATASAAAKPWWRIW